MKLICNGLDLSDAVLTVSKALNSKTTNPVLEGIKLSASGDKLVLTATDTELTIEKTIMLTNITKNIKVVPQRSCTRVHFLTFSTVRGIPYS